MNFVRARWNDLLTAVQFLTRIPVPQTPYDAGSLARAVTFFPVVGLLIGALAAGVHRILIAHLPASATSLFVVLMLVLITGALHEDGLADAADGFGGGHTKEKILLIFRDSRIGSYGASALALGLMARVMLVAALPVAHVTGYLIAAHVLCRWTTLPLSHYLSAARDNIHADGQGARIARRTSTAAMVVGSLFSLAAVAFTLRMRAIAPVLATILITAASARYYQRKIGGVTGDCFGATNQLTEIAIYLCGAWVV